MVGRVRLDALPLPPYRTSTPGLVALQVDVRRKDDPDNIDRRWLNQFSFLRDDNSLSGLDSACPFARLPAPIGLQFGRYAYQFRYRVAVGRIGTQCENALADLEFRLLSWRQVVGRVRLAALAVAALSGHRSGVGGFTGGCPT